MKDHTEPATEEASRARQDLRTEQLHAHGHDGKKGASLLHEDGASTDDGLVDAPLSHKGNDNKQAEALEALQDTLKQRIVVLLGHEHPKHTHRHFPT